MGRGGAGPAYAAGHGSRVEAKGSFLRGLSRIEVADVGVHVGLGVHSRCFGHAQVMRVGLDRCREPLRDVGDGRVPPPSPHVYGWTSRAPGPAAWRPAAACAWRRIAR